LPILYAVFNDGRYNMVHHGMRQIFGEADSYDTPRIDFSLWAAAMGIPARVIRWGGEIDRALLTELACDGPAVLDIRIDEQVRVRGGGRVEALQHMSMASK
jgi:acetolactate synthase-1/2/3 large subunit